MPSRFFKNKEKDADKLLPAALWIQNRHQNEVNQLEHVHKSFDKVASTLADFVRQIGAQPDQIDPELVADLLDKHGFP